MDHDLRPNYFIVGAAKCGTTSLHRYLEQHPDIFVTQVKEPHFFGSDLDVKPNRRIRREDEYAAMFADAGGAKARGEASSKYLFSTEAAREIKAYSPDAKIIIMLRNPIDMMWSWHGQQLYAAEEDILDFDEALAAQEDRRSGRRIPPGAQGVNELQYTRIATFSPQVKRFFDVFGRDNVKVIIFDDFAEDTIAVVRDVFRFLGVDDAFAPAIEVHNKGNWLRNPGVKRFLKGHPRIARLVNRTIPGSLRHKAGDLLLKVKGGAVERPQRMKPETRSRLCDEFRPEVQRLSELLGRDLSHWVDFERGNPPRGEPLQ